jgi:methyltransferase family protein
MFQDLLKWGAKRPDSAGTASASLSRGDDVIVSSKALPKFLSALTQSESPVPVLVDFGPVIGSNVGFFGERLGCKLFIEDLSADLDRHARAKTMDALPGVFEKRFRHADQSVDGLLCWDYFDFLDKASVQALSKQIVRMLKPGGAVMGFFCTSSVPRAGFTKYEIIDDATLRHRPHPGPEFSKTALQNRDIIRMFDGLLVSDSFLLKNNIREMLLRRR